MLKFSGWLLAALVATGAQVGAQQHEQQGIGTSPKFDLIRPTPQYLEELRAARASSDDYYYEHLKSQGDPTWEQVSHFLGPLEYVNAPWRYAGVILSPKGSTEKIRVIENGFQLDANLTRRSPIGANAWAEGDTHLWITVGEHDDLFGQDEHRTGLPHYEDGYIPVFQVEYRSGGTTYREEVLAHRLMASYRSPFMDEQDVAAYVRITAVSGPGQVGFQVSAPSVGYGFPIVPAGFRNNEWTDAHSNVYAYFSRGGNYDAATRLIRFHLKQGDSVFVVLPQSVQLAGTTVPVDAEVFQKAEDGVRRDWTEQLRKGGTIELPEKRVMDAYRSLLIGDWQLSIGDELPYGMFSWYEGNGYAEALQTIAPMIEYGYFSDARRFIQPILDYPLSDDGIGLHVCANRLELAAYYYALSGDAEFIRKNKDRLTEVADYLLRHRDPVTGLVMDGYGFDLSGEKVVNLNTNSNGWRGVRDLAVTLREVGYPALAAKYQAIADRFGDEVRQAVLENINHSTNPPFVPFALGSEKPYASLVESRASSYYNIMIPYFFESELFPPRSEPYTDTLNYMWTHQGVMAGLNRFNGHGPIYGQDGIHPLYSWGREFSQISRHETRRSIYTFYSALANGFTRGTYLTGESQSTVPSDSEWRRGTYLPPEPPANALILRSLRHMLIHEYDRNQDGIYDELWLLSSAPTLWIGPGKHFELQAMPSRFGPVTLVLDTNAAGDEIRGSIALSSRASGKKVLLFVRGYQIESARLSGGAPLKCEQMDGDDVVELPAVPRAHFVLQVRAAAASEQSAEQGLQPSPLHGKNRAGALSVKAAGGRLPVRAG